MTKTFTASTVETFIARYRGCSATFGGCGGLSTIELTGASRGTELGEPVVYLTGRTAFGQTITRYVPVTAPVTVSGTFRAR